MLATSNSGKYTHEKQLTRLTVDKFYEVIDGELVKAAPNGGLHHFITANLYSALQTFVAAHRIGMIFTYGLMYLLEWDDKRLYNAQIPDVSFVRNGMLPKPWDIRRPFPGAPVLAVEVMSYAEKAERVLRRTRQYLRLGSEQVWVVFPDAKEVHQYRRGADTIRVYTDADAMEIDDLFPGLTLTLTEVFAIPDLN